MGETGIDQDTFNDYLEELRETYTADKVRSLLHLQVGPGPNNFYEVSPS
jgi:hypothetical protein